MVDRGGASIVTLCDRTYPPLLRQIPDPPTVLFVRGSLGAVSKAYTVAMVGSRTCTAYGIEQAERFSTLLTQSGLCVVSGGARGIDTAAHRAAVRVGGQTAVVLGCGLSHVYPPENTGLFDDIVAHDGAILSELPMGSMPVPENFPRRNRIIAGLSLGVLVIEAPVGSGALITARSTVDQGREAMAIPGRVDSLASAGSHELIRDGSAALVTSVGDVLNLLEGPARHLHAGTHDALYDAAGNASDHADPMPTPTPTPSATSATSLIDAALTDRQRTIVKALKTPSPLDAIEKHTGIDPGTLRAELTVLEIRQIVVRKGSTIELRT